MNPLSRLRQACPRDHQGPVALTSLSTLPGQGPSASDDALGADPPPVGAAGVLQAQDSHLALNRLYLSGVLLADPIEDKGRDGNPVALLLIAFPAPDSRESGEGVETASCEIEVPAEVSKKHGGKLGAGELVFLTGQLSGGGGVIATELHSGPAPEQIAPERKGSL